MKMENCDVIDRGAKIPLLAEDAHEDCEMEWWFFQGEYHGEFAKKSFMVLLLKMKLEEEESDEEYGFELILTLLDSENATEHHTETWIDDAWFTNCVARIDASDFSLDDSVVGYMLEEMKRGQALRYSSLKESLSCFESSPLNIKWDHFVLKQEADHFALQFNEPGSGEKISLRLEPLVALFNIDCLKDDEQLGKGMAYHTIPRMLGRGMRGQYPIESHTWMDHQWGSMDWLHDREESAMKSWDWFGINLEDGSDWVVIMLRETRTSEPVFMLATSRDRNGHHRSSKKAILTKLKNWESPRTHIVHPIAWDIDIPELAAEFRFTPLFEDQEVYTPEVSRAIWEGAGTVSGYVNGEAVHGNARGEFTGNGCIFDFQDLLKQLGGRVDRCLEEFIPRQIDLKTVEGFVGPATWIHEPESFQKTISDPVWDLIDRSGKRWRPVFGMLLLESLGVLSGPWEGLIAAMTELIHTGALIVDDVEDESVLRRGGDCTHLKYGVDVALNAANALYFLPGVALFKHPLLTAEKRARLHEIKEYVCIEAHCGQATDIYWSRELSRGNLENWLQEGLEDKILQMYAYKTAAGAVGPVAS